MNTNSPVSQLTSEHDTLVKKSADGSIVVNRPVLQELFDNSGMRVPDAIFEEVVDLIALHENKEAEAIKAELQPYEAHSYAMMAEAEALREKNNPELTYAVHFVWEKMNRGINAMPEEHAWGEMKVGYDGKGIEGEQDFRQSSPQKKISEVERLVNSAKSPLRNEKELSSVVEEPWLPAAVDLYRKNIRTLTSSANSHDLTFSTRNEGNNYAYLLIDFATLSEENKQIARAMINREKSYSDIIVELGDYGGNESLMVYIPITASSTIKEFTNKAMLITNEFAWQKRIWDAGWTLEEMREMYRSPEARIDDFKGDFYFDSVSAKFFVSKEHCVKVNENRQSPSASVQSTTPAELARDKEFSGNAAIDAMREATELYNDPKVSSHSNFIYNNVLRIVAKYGGAYEYDLGDLVIHNDQGILLVGYSRAGKSTLAHSLVRAGAKFDGSDGIHLLKIGQVLIGGPEQILLPLKYRENSAIKNQPQERIMPVLQFKPIKAIVIMKSLRNTTEPYVKSYSSLSSAAQHNEEIGKLYAKFGGTLSLAVIEVGLPLSPSAEQISLIVEDLLRFIQIAVNPTEIRSPSVARSGVSEEILPKGKTAGIDDSSHPLGSDSSKGNPGGIDFRTIPIVIQAISNLHVGLSGASLTRLQNINISAEWQDIDRLVNSGITPSTERIKEYIQAVAIQGEPNSDISKVVFCIADIFRLEEERCDSSDPALKDILIVLESGRSNQELKEVFVGRNI